MKTTEIYTPIPTRALSQHNIPLGLVQTGCLFRNDGWTRRPDKRHRPIRYRTKKQGCVFRHTLILNNLFKYFNNPVFPSFLWA